MNGSTITLQAIPAADVPNPVVAIGENVDGGHIRVYANGLVDATDGFLYSVSPGFQSVDELVRWTRQSLAQFVNECRAEVAKFARHPYASPCGEADAAADRLADAEDALSRAIGDTEDGR